MRCSRILLSVVMRASVLGPLSKADGHDASRKRFERARRLALARAAVFAEDPEQVADDRPMCRLSIELVEEETAKTPAKSF